MSERLILKLGGSVITDKGADCVVSRSRLAALAKAVSGAKSCGTVIIHGAGSCGHPEAKRYNLDRGASCGNTEGIFVTHRAVSGLNDTVVAALRKAGVPALGIHPLHTGIADNGRLVGFRVPPPGKDACTRHGPCDPRRRGDGPVKRGLYRIGRPARSLPRGCLTGSAASGSPPMYRECWMEAL